MTPDSESPAPSLPSALLPSAAFFAGAAVMIVEISGARLIAPVYGNTIYTWTALIGVVLVAMSAGGYFGGRLADRSPNGKTIGVLLAAAGMASAVIPTIAAAVSGWVSTDKLILGPLFLSAMIFVIPALLLGAISPYAVKLMSVQRADHAVGRSAGLISMMGALGSFVGTFATGFWLLSAFDLRHILAAVGLFLVVLALPFLRLGGALSPAKSLRLLVLTAAAVGLGVSTPLDASRNMLFAKNTYYHLIRVAEQNDARGQKIRVLMMDSTMEGGINLENDSLPLPYQNYWRILTNDAAFQPKNVLFIGAGAFGMPRHVSQHWPQARVDVAEIDPEVIAVGREFFKLDSAPNVHAHAADGRLFLRNQAAGHYDFIFGDAYNGVSYIPPHLVTREFFGQIAERLTPDGVYMMNLIGALRGPSAELTSGILGGIKAHFPHVAMFNVQSPRPEMRQNLILLASRQPLERFLPTPNSGKINFAEALVTSRVPDVLLAPMLAQANPFTDYHNPIDRIIAASLMHEAQATRHNTPGS